MPGTDKGDDSAGGRGHDRPDGAGLAVPDGAGLAVPPAGTGQPGRHPARWLRRHWDQAPDGSRYHRRRASPVAAATGLAVLAVCGVLVATKLAAVTAADEAVFRWVNHWPGWLFGPMWVVQLSGVVGAIPLLAVLAALRRTLRLAAALAAAALLKASAEAVAKTLVQRERPAETVSDMILRRGAPAHGLSFPSGHATVIFAIAALVTPYLPGRWKILPWVLGAAVCLSRMYLGAHFPLDVVGGAGLGLFIGATLNLVFGVPQRARSGR